jgi:hypothetical protein
MTQRIIARCWARGKQDGEQNSGELLEFSETQVVISKLDRDTFRDFTHILSKPAKVSEVNAERLANVLSGISANYF